MGKTWPGNRTTRTRRDALPIGEVALLAVAVAGISASAPLAAAAAAPALAIAFWRNAIASGLLWGQALTRPRIRMSARDLRGCLVAGLFLAAHFATWIPSLSMTSVAASTALVCTTPLWSGLIARFRGQAVTALSWAGMALAVVGVLIISSVDIGTSPKALLGDLLALFGGVCMAAYLAVGERVRQRVETGEYTLLCYSAAAVALLVACLVSDTELIDFSLSTWILLGALTIAGQLLGHSLLNRSLRILTGPTVASISLLEVPGAALLAGVWLGQVPGWSIWGGVVVILAGVWLTVRGSAD